MATLMTVTELPEDELREHPDDVLRRVKDGEEFVLTDDGEPFADLRPAAPKGRSITVNEVFEKLEKIPYDSTFASDIRDLVNDTTDDEDPLR